MEKENLRIAHGAGDDAGGLSAQTAAMSLLSDYLRIFYVNIESEAYIEYEVDGREGRIREICSGSGFFAKVQEKASYMIFEDDRELIRNVFIKENITAAVDHLGAYILTFRVLYGDVPKWMHLKAVRAFGDQDHYVIGISDVDYQMNLRDNYERASRERELYSRIASLSGDYIAINTIDPVTNRYTEYSPLEVDFEGLGLPRQGEDFFRDLTENCHKMICAEDLPLFYSAFSKEHILSEIRNRGIFTLNYRLMFGDVPKYVSMRFVMVKENGRDLLIAGLGDVDSQVKQNREYANNLFNAREQATKDALTGVRNKLAYDDMADELAQKIKNGEDEPFAILVFDVNDLKKVNDTRGHQAGDEYLKKACMIICNIFKHSPVYRIGGDEFAVIATGSDMENIPELMEKLSKSNCENQASGGPVIACGAAFHEGESRPEMVFQKADQMMYENKKQLKEQMTGGM